jgi:hypothetical protein
MKFGFRVPSLKKRIAARTSWKRVVRHSLGLKAPRGWGWLTNPRKAAYNRVYNRTSFDIFKTASRALSGSKRQKSESTLSPQSSLLSVFFGVVRGLVIIGLTIAGLVLALSVMWAIIATRSDKGASTPLVQRPKGATPMAAITVSPAASPAVAPNIKTATASVQLTAAEAQREAVRRYPDLGVAGSKLNAAFVARYKLYQQQRPEYFRDNTWPIRLAEEVEHDINSGSGGRVRSQ